MKDKTTDVDTQVENVGPEVAKVSLGVLFDVVYNQRTSCHSNVLDGHADSKGGSYCLRGDNIWN